MLVGPHTEVEVVAENEGAMETMILDGVENVIPDRGRQFDVVQGHVLLDVVDTMKRKFATPEDAPGVIREIVEIQ